MVYINKNKMAETGHVDLNSIEDYIRNKTYPEKLKDKGRNANFRKACKKFTIADGHLTYKGKKRVIFEESRKQSIIHDVHEGISDRPEAVALSGHCGRESTYQKYQKDFTGMVWSMTLRITLKHVRNANTKERFLKKSALIFKGFILKVK